MDTLSTQLPFCIPLQIALFEPEIPQNVGTILRLGACLGIPIHIIEPCGFAWNDKHLKRSGMDYLDHVTLKRHDSWDHFLRYCYQHQLRLVFLDVHGKKPYTSFTFHDQDVLIAGREGTGFAGLNHPLHNSSVKIPLKNGQRSLNVAVSLAMAAGEALRQLNAL